MVGNSNRDSEFPARNSPMHCKRRVRTGASNVPVRSESEKRRESPEGGRADEGCDRRALLSLAGEPALARCYLAVRGGVAVT